MLSQAPVQGNITAASGAASVVSADCNQSNQTGVQVTGTFTATLQFEATIDGSNWASINANPLPSGAGVTSATAAGVWQITTAGMTQVRVRCSAYTSGTAVVTIAPSQG